MRPWSTSRQRQTRTYWGTAGTRGSVLWPQFRQMTCPHICGQHHGNRRACEIRTVSQQVVALRQNSTEHPRTFKYDIDPLLSSWTSSPHLPAKIRNGRSQLKSGHSLPSVWNQLATQHGKTGPKRGSNKHHWRTDSETVNLTHRVIPTDSLLPTSNWIVCFIVIGRTIGHGNAVKWAFPDCCFCFSQLGLSCFRTNRLIRFCFRDWNSLPKHVSDSTFLDLPRQYGHCFEKKQKKKT